MNSFKKNLWEHKAAVFADEDAVEPDFATADGRVLTADDVPVDLTVVAVGCFFVALTGGEVERAGDFFVEQRITHRITDVGVHAERPFTEVAGTFVGIEDFVELGGVGAGFGLDDFALRKCKVDVCE